MSRLLHTCLSKVTTMFLFVIPVLHMTGCIHTYPNGEAEDPSLINLTLLLTDDTGFTSTSKEDGEAIRLGMPKGVYRFKTLLIRSGKAIVTEETLVNNSNAESSPLELPVQTPLPQQPCDIIVWGELVDIHTLLPCHYDTQNLSAITPLNYWDNKWATPAQSIFPICLRGETRFNPDDMSNLHLVSERNFTVDVPCKSPAGVLRMETTDLSSFVEAFPNVKYVPGAFSVELSFTTPAPLSLHLLTDSPSQYTTGKSVNIPLYLPDATAVKIVELPLFPSKEGDELTAELTVFNSARSIISRTSGIHFTLYPNRTTTVRGAFLSNYFESPLKVESEWEGEIEIDYD